MSSAAYIGRFAPSPTGPLHFGSLVAAVGSFLQARARQGRWLLRMEDLDPPREVPGAADEILRALDIYGLHWDGPVLYQSRRAELYQSALEQLRRDGQVYGCGCSRREIAQAAPIGAEGPIYPGICRDGLPTGKSVRAIRLRTHDQPIGFEDQLQGTVCQRLSSEIGDFVIHRADGLFAYQLAVVVDDEQQGVTEVVRGADLLGSTPRQIFIQQLLGFALPRYMHLPIATDRNGEKLSKQTRAPALPLDDPLSPLIDALEFLNQDPPAELTDARLDELWRWAIAHWEPDRIPRVEQLRADAS